MAVETTIAIFLNTVETLLPADMTVAALVQAEAADQPVAVALNQQVLPKRLWASTKLQRQDQVLLFQLVAGG
jgi:sulfur carrier protein